MSYNKCENCGKFVDDLYQVCPNCGQVIKAAVKKEKRTLRRISLITILVIFAVLGFFGKRQWDIWGYEENLRDTVSTMYSGIDDATELGNRLNNVWYNWANGIKDEQTDPYTRDSNGTGSFYRDVSDVIGGFFADGEVAKAVSAIEKNRSEVMQGMHELSDPPAKYRTGYEALKPLYRLYLEYIGIVTGPSGTYETFHNRFSETYDALESASYDFIVEFG